MSSKAKKPDPRKVQLTQGQADIFSALARQAQVVQDKTATVAAMIAAGAGIEKWGTVNLDGLTLTFSKAEE